MTHRADVVVVGGGVIGAAITYYLAVRGIAVTLVERGDLASGTSSACGGSLLMQTKTAPFVVDCALRSQAMYRGLSDELGYDLEYRQDGSYLVAETDAEIQHAATLTATQRRAGLQIEWFEGTAARKWGEGLGQGVRAASFCASDAEVNPMRVAVGFGEAAKRHGATLFVCTRVTGITLERGAVAGVQTDRGEITTRIVVNAAGVWAPHVARMAGVELPIQPRRGVVLVTEPMPPRRYGTLISTKYLVSKGGDRDEGTASKSRFTGGLVLSETSAGHLLLGSSREFAGHDVSTPIEITSFIAAEALRIVPALAGARVIRAYAGLRPWSPDGVPMIGYVGDVPGLIVAGGHEGDGVALAPWTGQTVAELICGVDVSGQLAPFDPSRFRRHSAGPAAV